MARINVEERALVEGRLSDLASDLSISKFEALGVLVFFWHDSQERRVVSAERPAIERFIPIRERRAEVFDALLRNGYVSAAGEAFVIHGNRKHVDNFEVLRGKASKGGVISGEKRRKKSEETKPALQKAEPEREPNSIHSSSIQGSSDQFNSVQHTTASAGARAPAGDPAKRVECVSEWGRTLKKFGIGKDPRLDEFEIARLIQRYGPEKTILALRGAGRETGSADYKPAKHCRITRLDDKDTFEKFVNLGAQDDSAATSSTDRYAFLRKDGK